MRFFGRFKRVASPGASRSQIFQTIYAERIWKGRESASGRGSDSDQTRKLRAELPGILRNLEVRSLVDVPCGDFNWMSSVMRQIPDVTYIGGDLVHELVAHNIKKYAKPGIEFRVIDLLQDDLPPSDLLFCRDCLVHMSYDDIRKALSNISRARVTYVALTTFPRHAANRDIRSGRWRPLNLQAPPFALPAPVVVMEEDCTEEDGAYSDKSIAVWRVGDVSPTQS